MTESSFLDTNRLVDQAQTVLRGNDSGSFTKPGLLQYPHQWNWDSAIIALGLSHFDLPRALLEIRSLLRGQWQDGMIPHILFNPVPSDYFPGPDFWKIENSPLAPSIPTSGITQPPVLSSVIRRVHERTPLPDFIREVFPALLGWHRWLHTARDPNNTGAVAILHPWESGTDDSPRWLKVMSSINPRRFPRFQRGDTQHVNAAERPYHSDYERFIHLIDLFRRNHYEADALYQKSPFLVQDVLFNSIQYQADQDLVYLAGEIGEPTQEIETWLANIRAHFDEIFWDKAKGLYFDYNVRKETLIPVNSATTFMPLYAGLASIDQAQRLIHEHWLNPAEYHPEGKIRYRITSISQKETGWDPRRYWRGPIWILLNWFLYKGLCRYGYGDLAADLRRDSLELVTQWGFREYYDPRDGTGCGSTDFSWSAALTIEWLMGE